jgi:hypothetical protein
VSEMDEKIRCLMADIGGQVGEVLRCIIQVEVASQIAHIQQLHAVLNGTACGGDVPPPT